MLRAVSTNKNGIYIDPTFEQNYKGARENGIPVGAYFFTYAQDEATQNKEFEMLFKALDGKTLQYPVALDIEDKNTASIGKNRLIAPMTRIPAFLPAATCRNVKAVNGITSLLPRRNATKKQRVIRKRITLCFLVKPFLHKFGVNVVSNQPNRVDKRRGINAF